MNYDVAWVREQFPALQRTFEGRTVAYLDGPGGSQVARQAIAAMVAYMTDGGANLHGVFPTSVETEGVLASARDHVAAFLGARPCEIAFGPNMTTLTLAIARALSREWAAGDEVVVTELDHRANVDPWLTAARDRGADAQFIPVNVDSLTLDLTAARRLITPKTKVVAIGLASNAVGTVSQVRAVAEMAHAVGALVVVDAVHAAAHIPIDRDSLDADVLLCSAYKFFGPHIGMAAIREAVFAKLQPYKLEPAPNGYPDNLETGTQSHEGIAGVTGALRLIAEVGEGHTLAERLHAGMQRFHAYESGLAAHLRESLARIPGVRVYAAPASVEKTSTVAFRVAGVHPRAVCEHLLKAHAVFIADGDFYATTLAKRLDIANSGGWVRAGLAPYTTEEEVERVVKGVTDMVSKR